MTVGGARGTWRAPLATLALAALLASAIPAAAVEPLPGPAVPVALFNSSETSHSGISGFPKWQGALEQYARERHLEDAPCAGQDCALQEWKAFVDSLAGQSRLAQLRAVNAYANRIPYRTDRERYGVVDHWATPLESLGRTADCEDYAIIKYLSLRKLGWPASALRIVVLKHEVRNEVHAVLVAYYGGTAYVLDNLVPQIREHTQIGHYRPIFSINEVAWHYHRDWTRGGAMLAAKTESRQLAARQPSPPAAPPVARAAEPALRSYASGPSESLAAALEDDSGRIR